MSENVKKGALVAAIVFILMFILGFAFTYVEVERNRYPYNTYERGESPLGFSNSVSNIASKKVVYQEGGKTRSVDQKYEKVANIEAKSPEIEKDEAAVRDLIETSGSIIQYESASGLRAAANRVINLTIGVPPQKFDSFVGELKAIGRLTAINIDKRDKTNEYKELQAKKESLMKIRGSLLALKSRGGKIEEFIQLENRILEIEEEIQKLGLSLGEFDSENEFCTVKLRLSETNDAASMSLLMRLRRALGWSIKYYFLLSFGFLFFTLSVALALRMYEKNRDLFIKKK